MQLKNYTGKAIHMVRFGYGAEPSHYRTIPSNGYAHVSTRYEHVGGNDWVDGLPTFTDAFYNVFGLPQPEDGVVIIVTEDVMRSSPKRTDLVTLFGMVGESLSHIAATGIIMPKKRVPTLTNV